MNLVDVIKRRLSGKLSRFDTVKIEGRTFILTKEVRIVLKPIDAAVISFYNDDGKLVHDQQLDYIGWKNLYENEFVINFPDMWVLLEVRNDQDK